MSGTQSSVKEVPFSSGGVLTSRRKNVTCSFGNCEASLSTVLLEHGLGQGFLHKSGAVIEETVWACADLKCQEEEHISPVSGWAPGRLRAVSQTLPEWPRRSQCLLSISSATVLNQTHSQARGCQRLRVMPGRPREVLSAIAGLFLAETVSCPVWVPRPAWEWACHFSSRSQRNVPSKEGTKKENHLTSLGRGDKNITYSQVQWLET